MSINSMTTIENFFIEYVWGNECGDQRGAAWLCICLASQDIYSAQPEYSVQPES